MFPRNNVVNCLFSQNLSVPAKKERESCLK